MDILIIGGCHEVPGFGLKLNQLYFRKLKKMIPDCKIRLVSQGDKYFRSKVLVLLSDGSVDVVIYRMRALWIAQGCKSFGINSKFRVFNFIDYILGFVLNRKASVFEAEESKINLFIGKCLIVIPPFINNRVIVGGLLKYFIERCRVFPNVINVEFLKTLDSWHLTKESHEELANRIYEKILILQ